eukprot:gene7364-7575_t
MAQSYAVLCPLLIQSEVDSLRQEITRLTKDLQLFSNSSTVHIPYEDLDVQDEIGGGGWSIVHRGSWRGTPVAIKRWFNPNLQEDVQDEFRQEVMTLQQLHHPHIVQFLGACMKPPNLCLVTEHLPHTLHNVLYQQQGVTIDRKRVLSMAVDVARALVFLHHVRRPAVVHRDIKPSNFLLDRSWRVKLADFGLAANSSKQAHAGTPQYMAPELLQLGKPYSSKVDIYAFGIMLNEMLSRSPPWSGMAAPDVKRQVLAGQRPLIDLSCPKPLQDLVSSCWAQEPDARPDANVILEQLQLLIKQLT